MSGRTIGAPMLAPRSHALDFGSVTGERTATDFTGRPDVTLLPDATCEVQVRCASDNAHGGGEKNGLPERPPE